MLLSTSLPSSSSSSLGVDDVDADEDVRLEVASPMNGLKYHSSPKVILAIPWQARKSLSQAGQVSLTLMVYCYS